MIAANAPGTAAGPATRPTGGGATDAARDTDGGDGGFAGLLTGQASQSPAEASIADSASETRTRTGTETETDDTAAADTPTDPILPERLLALIAGWPVDVPGTARAAALVPVPGAAPPSLAKQDALSTPLPATAMGPLAPPTAGNDTTLAPLPATSIASGDTDIAASSAGTTGPPIAPTTTNANAIAMADFARTLGLAATTDAAAAATPGIDTAVAPEFSDRGALLAPPVSTTSAARAAGTIATELTLTLPTNPDAGFDDAFGARISWLADQRIGRAEIRLNPEHLGAIEVRLQIDGTRISAEFQSPHADVRQALENSVARLRDMLGQHGMQLAHTDVGQGRAGEHRDRGARHSDGRQSEHESGPTDRPLPPMTQTRGLLDEYA